MSDIFTTYEQEYATLRTSISQKLSVDIVHSQGETKRKLCAQVERELEEADEILSHMEIELQSLPQKGQLTPRLRAFRDEMRTFRQNLTTAKATGLTDRDILLANNTRSAPAGASRGTTLDDEDMVNRDRIMRDTARLEEGSRRLDDARRVAMDTEQVGIATLETLGRQREQLLRTRDTLSGADAFVSKSTALLKTMQRRLKESKYLHWILIFLLIVLIFIVIYLKWIS